MAEANARTIGRDASCDLVLEHATVSGRHARVEMDAYGHLSVTDTGSAHGLFLRRNDAWIRVLRARLCVGDEFRCGECAVPVERLAGLFPAAAGARLAPRPRGALPGRASLPSAPPARPAAAHKPRRDPLTGKVDNPPPESKPE